MILSLLKKRITLNILLRFAYSPQDSGRKITKLSHSLIKRGKHTFHRVYAFGNQHWIHGAGVQKSMIEAECVAIMEFLERRYFFEKLDRGTTSGLACHFCKSEAKKNALFELIERDQALLSVFYKDTLVRIVDSGVESDFELYHLTFDLPLHVIMARICHDGDGQSFGFGCSYGLETAINKAISEMILVDKLRDNSTAEPFSKSLYHLLPFLYNDSTLTSLPLFHVRDYKIVDVPKKSFINFTQKDLISRLEELNIKIDYHLENEKIGAFHKIYFCQASSPDLQQLFFSKSEIKINERRLNLMNPVLPKVPLHPVLHPIS